MSDDIRPLTMSELEAGLERIRQAPRDAGTIELIVRRPAAGERELLALGEFDPKGGLIGDNWSSRGSRHTDDGRAHPDMQLTLMNARAAALLAQTKERWPLAGDQVFVDFDLGVDNLQPGVRLQLGSAVIEITDQPHNGCRKFMERFGADALRFVNQPVGRDLKLRGIYARVVEGGSARPGDIVRKL